MDALICSSQFDTPPRLIGMRNSSFITNIALRLLRFKTPVNMAISARTPGPNQLFGASEGMGA